MKIVSFEKPEPGCFSTFEVAVPSAIVGKIRTKSLAGPKEKNRFPPKRFLGKVQAGISTAGFSGLPLAVLHPAQALCAMNRPPRNVFKYVP